MTSNVVRPLPARPCAICGKPATQQFHPFCSGRCADIDLNRWLSGSYVIPAEPVEDDEDDLPTTAGSIPDDEDE